jgi:hypothetical protein
VSLSPGSFVGLCQTCSNVTVRTSWSSPSNRRAGGNASGCLCEQSTAGLGPTRPAVSFFDMAFVISGVLLALMDYVTERAKKIDKI